MRQNQAIIMQIAASLANVNNRLNKFEKIDSSQLTSSESVSNLRKEPHDLSSSDVSECESESRNSAFAAYMIKLALINLRHHLVTFEAFLLF